MAPYLTTAGGPLDLRKLEYTPGRANLLVKLPAESGVNKWVTFGGMHMDVVPADPSQWKHDPFTFRIDGDDLYGRGTTDCLGHVALVTVPTMNAFHHILPPRFVFFPRMTLPYTDDPLKPELAPPLIFLSNPNSPPRPHLRCMIMHHPPSGLVALLGRRPRAPGS